MKTTHDDWPVYEDTGERVVAGEAIFDVYCDFADCWHINHLVVDPGDYRVFDDESLYFRHPHNAAAAWLKAVSEPTEESQ